MDTLALSLLLAGLALLSVGIFGFRERKRTRAKG